MMLLTVTQDQLKAITSALSIALYTVENMSPRTISAIMAEHEMLIAQAEIKRQMLQAI